MFAIKLSLLKDGWIYLVITITHVLLCKFSATSARIQLLRALATLKEQARPQMWTWSSLTRMAIPSSLWTSTGKTEISIKVPQTHLLLWVPVWGIYAVCICHMMMLALIPAGSSTPWPCHWCTKAKCSMCMSGYLKLNPHTLSPAQSLHVQGYEDVE